MALYLYGLLFILSLIWGGSFFFIKVLVESYGPFTVAFLRCLFGVLALLPILFFLKEKIEWKKVPWKALIAVGFLNSTIPWSLIAYSEQSISSGLASVLNASTPIWTLLMGIIFFQLRSQIFQYIGIFVGFMGILILVDIDWHNLKIDNSLAVGAMLLCTLCYGLSSQICRRHFQQLSVYQTSFITLGIGTISSVIPSMALERPDLTLIATPSIFLSLLGLGVLGSGIAYILFYILIQKGSAEFATLVTYLVPPFAILWGYLFLDEAIHLSLFVGLAVILLGVYISGKKKREKAVVQAEAEQTAV